MPETYPEQHSECAQVLIHGSNQERLRECVKMLFYKLSNNHLDSFSEEEWKVSRYILQGANLLNLKVNLRNSEDITVSAFTGHMFCEALQCIGYNRLMNNSDDDYSIIDDTAVAEALTAILWLLSMGQNPDIKTWDKNTFLNVTPLQGAILSGCLDLVEILLQNGADPSPMIDSESLPPPLYIALNKTYFSKHIALKHVVDCLLNHRPSMNWDHALHIASNPVLESRLCRRIRATWSESLYSADKTNEFSVSRR
jgi:hypothetical protein